MYGKCRKKLEGVETWTSQHWMFLWDDPSTGAFRQDCGVWWCLPPHPKPFAPWTQAKESQSPKWTKSEHVRIYSSYGKPWNIPRTSHPQEGVVVGFTGFPTLTYLGDLQQQAPEQPKPKTKAKPSRCRARSTAQSHMTKQHDQHAKNGFKGGFLHTID